jgi:hypothetical protein
MAVYSVARCGARIVVHFFSITLDIPEGPGTLKGLIFSIVFATCSGVKDGNVVCQAFGGLVSRN